jgi:hypothetical protein
MREPASSRRIPNHQPTQTRACGIIKVSPDSEIGLTLGFYSHKVVIDGFSHPWNLKNAAQHDRALV